MEVLQSPEQWEELLSALHMPDTNIIRAATDKLMQLVQNPESLVRIFERLSNSQSDPVRQQAAIICRKFIAKHWGSINDSITEAMKISVVEIINSPQTPSVIRRSVADIAVTIAKLSNGNWPGFLPWVADLVKSEFAPHREIGIYFFQDILESGPLSESQIVKSTEEVVAVMTNALRDPSADVRVRAFQCCNSFVELQSQDDLEKFLPVIPVLVAAIKTCIEDDDNRINPGFEVLEYFIEYHIEMIEKIIPDLVMFMLAIGANAEHCDISFRSKALCLIEFIINYKPKTFCKLNLLQRTIDVSLLVMTEEEDDSCGDDTGSKYGSQLIDTISLHVPAKLCWPIFTKKIAEYIQHPNPEARKAAIHVIAIIADGCAELVEENFEDLMKCVLEGFKQEPQVKQAACIAIAEFAKNVPDELPPYAEQLLPMLMAGIHDPSDLVRVKSCYAITQVNTIFAEELMAQIEPLLTRLVELLTDKNPEVQELAVSALSSLVDMAEEKIEPYFNPMIEIMKKWLTVTDPEHILVRARATECIASLASAQKQLFLPHFQSAITSVLQGLQNVDDPELREFTYGYCEHMIRLYREEMTPYIDGLMVYLLASAISSKGFVDEEEGEEGEEAYELFKSDGGDMMGEDEDPDLTTLHKYLNEKESAVSCMGWAVFNYPHITQKYFPRVKEVLIELSSFGYSPNVPASAVTALVQLASAVQTLADNEFFWVKNVPKELHADVREIVDDASEIMMFNFESQDDIIVRTSLEAVIKLGQAFGPSALQENLPEIIVTMQALLANEAPCQQLRESFDEEDEGAILMFNTVMESTSILSKIYGGSLVPSLAELFKGFNKFLDENSTDEYQNSCIATIAEIIQELQGDFRPFCPAFAPFTIQLLSNPATKKTTKHNAAYCTALLIEHGGPTVEPFLEPFFVALTNTIANLNRKKYASAIDNAAGALARMVNFFPTLVPVPNAVAAIMQAMPLRDDGEPATAIYDCFFNLLRVNNPIMTQLLPDIIALMAHDIVTGVVSDATKQRLLESLKGMVPTLGEQISTVFTQLAAKGTLDEASLKQLHASLSS